MVEFELVRSESDSILTDAISIGFIWFLMDSTLNKLGDEEEFDAGGWM